MADSGDANGLSAVGQLVENSIGPHSQGVQTSELSSKGITGERVALEQTKSVLDRIDQRPGQLEEVATGSLGEDESCQGSAGGGPAIGKFAAKLSEGDRVTALELSKTRLQRRESVRIGDGVHA
jgi:hypothetical protein